MQSNINYAAMPTLGAISAVPAKVLFLMLQSAGKGGRELAMARRIVGDDLNCWLPNIVWQLKAQASTGEKLWVMAEEGDESVLAAVTTSATDTPMASILLDPLAEEILMDWLYADLPKSVPEWGIYAGMPELAEAVMQIEKACQ